MEKRSERKTNPRYKRVVDKGIDRQRAIGSIRTVTVALAREKYGLDSCVACGRIFQLEELADVLVPHIPTMTLKGVCADCRAKVEGLGGQECVWCGAEASTYDSTGEPSCQRHCHN